MQNKVNKKVDNKQNNKETKTSLRCAFGFHAWKNNVCTRCGRRK